MWKLWIDLTKTTKAYQFQIQFKLNAAHYIFQTNNQRQPLRGRIPAFVLWPLAMLNLNSPLFDRNSVADPRKIPEVRWDIPFFNDQCFKMGTYMVGRKFMKPSTCMFLLCLFLFCSYFTQERLTSWRDNTLYEAIG